jgi:formylglycine-generating enzyme required for sulfatase activity
VHPQVDPAALDAGSYKVLRGGNARSTVGECRVWSRVSGRPTQALEHHGFRPSLTLALSGAR